MLDSAWIKNCELIIRYFSSILKPALVCILRQFYTSTGVFFPPLALCCNLQMFSSQSARLSERRGEEPFAYESLFGRDGCQSIWAEMEKSSSCHKQSPLLSLPSRQTVPCRASGGERGGRSKKRNKHFKLHPQTKDGGEAELNETRGERENKDRLFHHL